MSKQDKIICLGKEFTSEKERRDYFRNELRSKLPELKKIEGFPVGEDEDIINLSDPPYYTACPNPWLDDFIAEWEKEKDSIPGRKKKFHVDEPYASDVSEGKTNQIYAAHSYHTKVPHPAIMRYILHYTEPGDIVLDGFAGTGMTAVAAISCANPDAETKYKIETEWKSMFGSAPTWGIRKSIVGDLAPVASFISYNYSNPVDLEDYVKEITKILSAFEGELGWMYETKHTNGKASKINYVVWSEVLACPNCNHEFSFTEEFYEPETKSVLDEIKCPSCSTELTKESCNLLFETTFDKGINQAVRKPKRFPYLINYSFGNTNYTKKPDDFDFSVLKRIKDLDFPEIAPHFKLPDIQMAKVGRVKTTNIEYIHDFFLERALQSLAYLWKETLNVSNKRTQSFLQFTFEQLVWGVSVLNRFSPSHFSQVNRALSGVFYVASHISEVSPSYILNGKIKRLIKAFNFHKPQINTTMNYCGDCTSLNIKENSIDYIFTDPPFGENIYYSDLNILIESWHKVLTKSQNEAIIDKAKHKTILDYQALMESCFKKYFQVLKPGKWMTVEFSNTSAAVWNGIQTALQRAGFVIANIAALDKQQGTFQAVTSPTAVKQDLVISCYKPSSEFETKFKIVHGDVAVWDFVSEHLHHLPVHMKKANSTTAIVERSPKIIFDRLITFYLMRGLQVPIDAMEFQDGLKQRFVEFDGMFFTVEQAGEYDEKKAKSPEFVQLSLIVNSESDAIEWLRDRLRKTHQKYQDITNDWKIATQALRKGDVLPELNDILKESFIQETDGHWRTPDPNEAKDREALRFKVLLREFNAYVSAISQPRAKKLKEVRVEALRAGFKNCWEQKDFKTIVTLGDMIPQNILLEDEQLLMYYDIAKDRI
ncbi:MAG: DNA methyltransferase [Methylococcales bacterium]|nr:DNA methyltransferase [Methylococcales bacterium]